MNMNRMRTIGRYTIIFLLVIWAGVILLSLPFDIDDQNYYQTDSQPPMYVLQPVENESETTAWRVGVVCNNVQLAQGGFWYIDMLNAETAEDAIDRVATDYTAAATRCGLER